MQTQRSTQSIATVAVPGGRFRFRWTRPRHRRHRPRHRRGCNSDRVFRGRIGGEWSGNGVVLRHSVSHGGRVKEVACDAAQNGVLTNDSIVTFSTLKRVELRVLTKQALQEQWRTVNGASCLREMTGMVYQEAVEALELGEERKRTFNQAQTEIKPGSVALYWLGSLLSRPTEDLVGRIGISARAKIATRPPLSIANSCWGIHSACRTRPRRVSADSDTMESLWESEGGQSLLCRYASICTAG